MKKRLLVVSLVFFILVVSIVSGAAFYWQKTTKSEVKIPYSVIDPSQLLSRELEETGIVLETPPAVLGDSIEASISGFTVLFSRSGDLAAQTRTLQLVLPRLKMESKSEKTIDLRFNKVVIR